MMDVQFERLIEIDYTNYRKERGFRFIVPIRLEWKVSEYHKDDGFQWILYAIDPEKRAYREFAFKDIHASRPGTKDEIADVEVAFHAKEA